MFLQHVGLLFLKCYAFLNYKCTEHSYHRDALTIAQICTKLLDHAPGMITCRLHKHAVVCTCMAVNVHCVCVCVCEREREREGVQRGERGKREREGVRVNFTVMYTCSYMYECVCVCVCWCVCVSAGVCCWHSLSPTTLACQLV